MTDVLRFVFIELGRFRKRLWELEGVFDKWMYLLKHMHEMVEIPKEFDDPLFRRLFLLAEINNFTAKEYEQYQKSLENMGDYQNIINTAVEEAELRGLAQGREEGLEEGMEKGREEGRQEGLQEGLQEGIKEGLQSAARKMLESGMPAEQVSAILGIPVEDMDFGNDSSGNVR